MNINRISGVLAALFGILLLVWIIPGHTEEVHLGWLRPATLPSITAAVIIVTGLIHALFPAGTAEFDVRAAGRAGLFFVISLAGLFLMRQAGFLIAAPILVMVLMLLVGERRPLWLFAGTVAVPLGIWSAVELLLKRPLP